VLVRQEIKDPRVRDAGLITFTHVRLTGDLRQARVFFTAHGADQPALERVRAGLDRASGFLRHVLGDKLGTKVVPSLTFEIDQVFDQEAKIEAILREVTGRGEPDKSG
jgi:ribosome-binding factor A